MKKQNKQKLIHTDNSGGRQREVEWEIVKGKGGPICNRRRFEFGW